MLRKQQKYLILHTLKIIPNLYSGKKMGEQNSATPTEPKQPNIDTLIEKEWEIVNLLNKKLKDPDIPMDEWLQANKVLGYHMNNLLKMLIQKGEKPQIIEKTLGDLIKDMPPQVRRRIRREFKTWQRRLSLRKS